MNWLIGFGLYCLEGGLAMLIGALAFELYERSPRTREKAVNDIDDIQGPTGRPPLPSMWRLFLWSLRGRCLRCGAPRRKDIWTMRCAKHFAEWP